MFYKVHYYIVIGAAGTFTVSILLDHVRLYIEFISAWRAVLMAHQSTALYVEKCENNTKTCEQHAVTHLPFLFCILMKSVYKKIAKFFYRYYIKLDIHTIILLHAYKLYAM